MVKSKSHESSGIQEWLDDLLGVGIKNPWSSTAISTQLSKKTLSRIKDNFFELPTQIKLKILMAIMHIPKRLIKEWTEDLNKLLDTALVDAEESVAMIAEILKPFPATGRISSEFKAEENERCRQLFKKLTAELAQELENAKDLNLIPLECYVLNKNVVETILGKQQEPVKHFQVKRTTKAEILREKILKTVFRAPPALPGAVRGVYNQSKKRPLAEDFVPTRVRGMPRKVATSAPGRKEPPTAEDFFNFK